MTPKRYAVLALFVGGTWLTGAGCGSDDSPSQGGSISGNGQGASGQGGKGTGGATVVDPGGTSSGGSAGRLHPLCGAQETSGVCLPDDARACRSYQPPSDAGAGAGGAARGGEGGSGGEAGELAGGAQPSSAGAPQGGAGAGPGGAPAGGTDGATGGMPGTGGQGGEGALPLPLPAYGCQVSRPNNQPYRSCVPAGVGTASAPCFTAADCAPGLACVTEGEAGRCLPYCCDPMTPCEAGSYCAERHLRKAPSDTSEAETPIVPVCVPADGCSLEDRYPCPEGSECRCKGNTACLVVRNGGTTTCLEPGPGKQGDVCPCAWNHVCSKLTNRCVQICRIDATTDECGTQKCQAASELPTNFGFCVGPT